MKRKHLILLLLVTIISCEKKVIPKNIKGKWVVVNFTSSKPNAFSSQIAKENIMQNKYIFRTDNICIIESHMTGFSKELQWTLNSKLNQINIDNNLTTKYIVSSLSSDKMVWVTTTPGLKSFLGTYTITLEKVEE